jgi:hypothetical protein
MDAQIIFAVVFPVLMAAGGIAAWRMSKKQAVEAEKPGWRDDSLDDWRKERDARAEAERITRPLEQPTHLSTGGEEQQETKKHQQRLGG